MQPVQRPARPRPPPPELAAAAYEEALVDGVVATLDAAFRDQARARFEQLGGAFSSSDPFHEERIRAFSDWLLAEARDARGQTPAQLAWLAAPVEDVERRAWLAGIAVAERSLFRVERAAAGLVLRCLLGGAVYRVSLEGSASRLREGDIFDGRIAPVRGVIRVLPGVVFHPAEAHASLLELTARARSESTPRSAVLDGLLRMRMRHDRFVSIHARHVYRFEHLATLEVNAAPWKR